MEFCRDDKREITVFPEDGNKNSTVYFAGSPCAKTIVHRDIKRIFFFYPHRLLVVTLMITCRYPINCRYPHDHDLAEKRSQK